MKIEQDSCTGELCDYERLLDEPSTTGLFHLMPMEVYFQSYPNDPRIERYKTLLQERFTDDEQERLKTCADCVLRACIWGHAYVEPDDANKYGSIS